MAEQLIAQDEARAAKRSARLAVKDRLKLLTEHEMAHESERGRGLMRHAMYQYQERGT